MSFALHTLGLAADVTGDNAYTVMLAALNVLQTIALAYLAAAKARQVHQ